MPLFFQLDIDTSTKLAVWNIEEEANFFLQYVPVHREIRHPHKHLQHLAGRYLLLHLFPQFPIELIKIADTSKPYLENEAYHFSISHCADFAAVIVSTEKRVGVDIEVTTPKLEKIKNRFSSSTEIEDLKKEFINRNHPKSSTQQLTLLWSCKEAIFKWYGLGGVVFRDEIIFKKIKQIKEENILTEICFKKWDDFSLQLNSRFLEDAVLSFVVT
ncbi:MAG TPA: 4'-phosphopantetheinyl transferase superfamily protein [Chitinophagaceae bacterium]|nr:4'-phosphopantetheinyl transferase superfamily protein [Chitinophagaceae bacterium]